MALRVLVYGGRGALGSHCVAKLRSSGCWVCTVDLQQNDAPDACIVAPRTASTLVEQEAVVMAAAEGLLPPASLDAILCLAGGWAGGNAASKNFVRNCELVLQQSVWSSIIAARLAAKYLRPGGLLTLTGSLAAVPAGGGATPGMIGYGLAKAAVHHLATSLAAPRSGIPEGATVLALLPATLDTPANRQAMGDAKTADWTPLEFVADLLHAWLVDKSARPASGSLLALLTRDSVTEVKPVSAL